MAKRTTRSYKKTKRSRTRKQKGGLTLREALLAAAALGLSGVNAGRYARRMRREAAAAEREQKHLNDLTLPPEDVYGKNLLTKYGRSFGQEQRIVPKSPQRELIFAEPKYVPPKPHNPFEGWRGWFTPKINPYKPADPVRNPYNTPVSSAYYNGMPGEGALPRINAYPEIVFENPPPNLDIKQFHGFRLR